MKHLVLLNRYFRESKGIGLIREGKTRSRNKQYPGSRKMDFAQMGSLDQK